ncbi:glycosyltransferase 87 family protein [Lysobacter sp. S4-A87]|uniref:glycosyltransferase 87 family protein n=1 Tax=Lysobacter sp. S4-A87 TaxID=2925843 RepID=UPI001F53CA72|nr:glycosyltransferase 87 family protein [Lysobacter sp. S4-A87]UNK48421.1 glycosyltransferase 87 family protein [Lysobacter sp. S4-A87]
MAIALDRAHRPMAWISRRYGFTGWRNVMAAAVTVAVLAGVASMMLGQDSNADLRNYHLYGAYAYLTDRLELDLAPAGLQSYLPPLLDVPYYLMATHLPPFAGAFLMGLWHGLSFILVAGIAWVALGNDPLRASRAPLLGLAGVLSGAFLSELGNTMGDNSTAPLVLAALLAAISLRDDGGKSFPRLAACGLVLGLAVGLKLTNAVFAVAVAAALLASQRPLRQRFADVAIVATFALASCVALVGAWFHRMWTVFGNPLLPQFNAWFQSPLAPQTMVSDTRWLPKSLSETVAWPAVMTLEPGQVGELKIVQAVWLLVYLLLVYWGARSVMARRRDSGRPLTTVERQVLVFVSTSFVVWMAVFCIHRYLVAAEIVAPLALWILARRLFPQRGVQVGRVAVTACAIVAVLGWSTWGNAKLTGSGFHVAGPEQQPRAASVVMTGITPLAWMLPFLPRSYRFVGLGPGFPEGPGYVPRARQILGTTPGRVFAIVPAVDDSKLRKVARMNRTATWLGLDRRCDRIAWLSRKLKLDSRPAARGGCEFALPSHKRLDVAAADARMQEKADAILSSYGMALRAGSCVRHEAGIGGDALPYQWCRIETTPWAGPEVADRGRAIAAGAGRHAGESPQAAPLAYSKQ